MILIFIVDDKIECNLPLVVDYLSKKQFLENYEKILEFNKGVDIKFISIGLEFSVELFKNEFSYNNHKLDKNLYWFFNKDDLKGKSWEDEFNLFFYKHLIEDNLQYKIEHKNDKHLIDIKEILDIKGTKIIDIINNKFLCVKEIETKIFYSFNLEFINYFNTVNISDISSLLKWLSTALSNKEYDNYISTCLFYNDDVLIRIKENGLLDKKHKKENLLIEIKDNKLILDYYRDILKYVSVPYFKLNIIDKKYIFNPYENLFKTEQYLSNVEINSIDIDLYNDLEFPYRKGLCKFTYNGSDNSTGRIFSTDENGSYQSLQNLNKEYKDVLNADKNCQLIEFDFKSFEFDILLQLLNKEIPEDFDPHIEIIKNCFYFTKPEKFRDLGKKINYSIIYGMNVQKLIDGISKDYNIENRDLLITKLTNHSFYEGLDDLRSKLYKENYIKEYELCSNYYGRFIKVDKEYALLNNFIQSTAVDFICYKILSIINKISNYKIDTFKNKILLQNHDSILLQLENKVIDETNLIDDIIKILKDPVKRIKGRFKMSFGDNWKNLR